MKVLKIHIDWQNEPMDIEVLSGILLDLNRINKFYSLQKNKKEKPENLRVLEAKEGSLILTLATKSAIQTIPEILKLFKDIYEYKSKNGAKPDLAEDIINLLNKFSIHFVINGITLGLSDTDFIDNSIDIIDSIKKFLDEEMSNRSSSYSYSGDIEVKYTFGKYKVSINGKWIVAHFDKNCSKQKLYRGNSPYSLTADYEVFCFDNKPKYVQINKIY